MLFCGQYRAASGRAMRNRQAPAITYGFSKDHRPDLKQLLIILTTEAEGGVPVRFRCTNGNTVDVQTHIETWKTLRAVAGRADFLYVADSKLCSYDNLDYIHRAGGRFVTIMPRSRLEDREFRNWLESHTPTPPSGISSGTGPMRATAMGRAIAGMCSVPNCPRPRAGAWSGSGARCSPCARASGAGATSPPPPRHSRRCASVWPRRGHAFGARRKLT